MFKSEAISGRNYALILLASGYETLSDAVKWDDPRKAAEYEQQALAYNREREDAQAVEENEEFIRGVSKTARCWFCGKEVSGENIHFVPMPAMMTDPVMKQVDKDNPLKTCDGQAVYACRACYSSIDNNGYKHYQEACKYTDESIQQLKDYTDNRFTDVYAALNDLQSQISSLRLQR